MLLYKKMLLMTFGTSLVETIRQVNEIMKQTAVRDCEYL